jgi:hypothetical protein
LIADPNAARVFARLIIYPYSENDHTEAWDADMFRQASRDLGSIFALAE